MQFTILTPGYTSAIWRIHSGVAYLVGAILLYIFLFVACIFWDCRKIRSQNLHLFTIVHVQSKCSCKTLFLFIFS